MNDTLKAAGRIGAELGAAKAENDRLRRLLVEAFASLCDGLEDGPQEAEWSLRDRALAFRIKDALSQQPVHSPWTEDSEGADSSKNQYTATDMINQSAQAFRDWQAAVEQAVVQDGREAFTPEIYRANDAKDGQYLGPVVLLIEHNRAIEQARATRPAQTAPQGKFRMGDLVKKSTGSEWEGRVVGWYSTEQTKEGYAVESSAHRNSVQIYPVTALEAVE